jgi:hypothetical protein
MQLAGTSQHCPARKVSGLLSLDLAAKDKEPGVEIMAVVCDSQVRRQTRIDHAKAFAPQLCFELETIH